MNITEAKDETSVGGGSKDPTRNWILKGLDRIPFKFSYSTR